MKKTLLLAMSGAFGACANVGAPGVAFFEYATAGAALGWAPLGGCKWTDFEPCGQKDRGGFKLAWLFHEL